MSIAEKFAEKLTTIASNVPRVYEAGAKSEYDRFWDAYQQNGTREVYEYAFAGNGWNNDTLKPKHPICPTFASNLFLNCTYAGDLRDLRVTFDFSQCQTISNLFGYFGGLTAVGDIDTTSSPTCTALFIKDRALVTIKKLILKDDGSQTFTNCFLNNDSLRNIEIEGVIGQDIDFQHSTKLSKASIKSIIDALSSSVSGNSVSLSRGAVIEAFRSGENLLSEPYIDSTKVENGITFTDNGDGTITANGTATADATYNVKVFKTTPDDSFVLVGCPVGGSASTYYIAYEGYGRDYGNGVMWDGSREFWDTVIIVIKKGTKVSNLKFAPQINNINEWNALVATKSKWTINLL